MLDSYAGRGPGVAYCASLQALSLCCQAQGLGQMCELLEMECHADLPRDIRDALVSWNHATDYELPSYSTYAGGKGTGLFEKTYDLGAHL